MPPRNSPVAIRGRTDSFIETVPNCSTAALMMRCELKIPETDIHTADTRSTILA